MNGLVLPPFVAAAFARQDAAEAERDRREKIDRAIEAEDRRAAAAADAERFELHHGYSMSELFQHMSGVADARDGRDATAEYGSANRAAVMIDGQPILSREQAARAQQPTQAQELDAKLERARSLIHDPYMTAQRAEWHRREIARRQRAACSEVSR